MTSEKQQPRSYKFWIDDDLIDEYASMMTPSAFRVYIAYNRYKNKHHMAWPSVRTLADRMHMGHDTILKAREELVELGFLVPVSRHNRRSHTYFVVPIEDFREGKRPKPTGYLPEISQEAQAKQSKRLEKLRRKYQKDDETATTIEPFQWLELGVPAAGTVVVTTAETEGFSFEETQEGFTRKDDIGDPSAPPPPEQGTQAAEQQTTASAEDLATLTSVVNDPVVVTQGVAPVEPLCLDLADTSTVPCKTPTPLPQAAAGNSDATVAAPDLSQTARGLTVPVLPLELHAAWELVPELLRPELERRAKAELRAEGTAWWVRFCRPIWQAKALTLWGLGIPVYPEVAETRGG